jgi:hypothetical protein
MTPFAPEDSLRLQFADAQARAMDRLQDWFVQRSIQEFNQSDWAYLTEPKLRDIVSSGRLRDSLVIRRTPDGGFEATWEEDYATDVHDGGTLLDGTKFLGRPWTRDILAELPAKYAQFLDEALAVYR